MSLTGTITTHESGSDFVVEWRIQGLSTLDDGTYYYSPDFSFGGERWYLGIYPNGSSYHGTSGHVDLELGKYDSGRSITLSVSLSLKTAKGERHREEHYTKDFDDYGVNRFHGFNRFIPRAELTRLRSDLLPNDVLTVVCTMKRTTSAEINTGNDPGHANVGASSQRVRPPTQRVRASAQTVEVSTQAVEATTQTVEASIATVQGKCEASASGSSVCPHDEELHHDLKELFLSKEDCDVIIKVKGSEFPAHRAILKARSPVFASTFRHDTKEKATGIVEIDDCDPSTFPDFLCYLYCGEANLISQENVFGFFTAADK